MLPVSLCRFAGLCLLLVACKKEPSRWDQAAITQAPATAPNAPTLQAGSSFNAAFPNENTLGYHRVFTQEKQGYAECKLQKEGKDIATLSINDVASDANARNKFAAATEKIGEHPLVTVGKNQSSVLVAGRYQLKVSSAELGPDERRQLLSAFNFGALPK